MDPKEESLRKRIAERPRNGRVTAQLSCLLAERARDGSTERDECEKEALRLAQRAIEVAPQTPFGYAALSAIHPVFQEKMVLLRRAVALSEDPVYWMAKIGLLVRLLVEPREEEARQVLGKICKASKRHPSRKDLNIAETALYEQLEKDIQVQASARPMLGQAGIEFLALQDCKLGIFFNKRNPSTVRRSRAVHHLKRVEERLPKDHENRVLAQFWLEDLSATTEISRCPLNYVVGHSPSLAENFDDLLVGKVEYRTPTVLRQLLKDTVAIPGNKWKRGADLGCGTGFSGLAFREYVQELVGVDMSPEMVEKARRRGCYDRLVVGDIAAALDLGSDYNLVFACDVFVYLGDLLLVFCQVYESLAKAGIFIFSTELLANASSKNVPFQLHSCARFAHSRRYIESLANNSGFTTLAMKHCPIRKNQGVDVDGLLVVLQKTTN
jgi:predicted TPR repeat methyltransferase